MDPDYGALLTDLHQLTMLQGYGQHVQVAQNKLLVDFVPKVPSWCPARADGRACNLHRRVQRHLDGLG
jgi:hypothetical protein